MSFNPTKPKKEAKSPTSIEGLAFRAIGAAMSTTPAVSLNLNQDNSGSYVSMWGLLSESSPGPRWSWDENLSDKVEQVEEESPYENVEIRRSPIAPERNVSLRNRRPKPNFQRPLAYSEEVANNEPTSPRTPIYENISDFIRSSEIELKYMNYDTLPAKRSSAPVPDPIYDTAPFMKSDHLYDAPPRTRTSAAALYDSIPCTVSPPDATLDDFHFRPLPNIKDRPGSALKKLFSLPKRFHKKKGQKIKKHPSMDALNEDDSQYAPSRKSSVQRLNNGDMMVSVDGRNGEDFGMFNQQPLKRHASVEVLLGNPQMEEMVVRPPEPPPPPKPPRNNITSKKGNSISTDITQSSKYSIDIGNKKVPTQVNFQHELRIVLEQKFGHDEPAIPENENDSLFRRRAVSCSNLPQRTSGPYDKPWDSKANFLLPPGAYPVLSPGFGFENDECSELASLGRKKSASMTDLSSQESLYSPKHGSSDFDIRADDHNPGNQLMPGFMQKSVSMANLSKINAGLKPSIKHGMSKSMVELTPQEELKMVLAKRAVKSEEDTEVQYQHKDNGTDTDDQDLTNGIQGTDGQNSYIEQNQVNDNKRKNPLNFKPPPPLRTSSLRKEDRDENKIAQSPKEKEQYDYFYAMPSKQSKRKNIADSDSGSESESVGNTKLLPLPAKQKLSVCRMTGRNDPPAPYDDVMVDNQHFLLPEIVVTAMGNAKGLQNNPTKIYTDADLKDGLNATEGRCQEYDEDDVELKAPGQSDGTLPTYDGYKALKPDKPPRTDLRKALAPKDEEGDVEISAEMEKKNKEERFSSDTKSDHRDQLKNEFKGRRYDRNDGKCREGEVYDVPMSHTLKRRMGDLPTQEESTSRNIRKVQEVNQEDKALMMGAYLGRGRNQLGREGVYVPLEFFTSSQEFCSKCEELLPGIEEFLTKVLVDENLSEAAEKKRQYYSERLDVLKLAFPPTLPPRNEGEEFIAQQRELARLRGPLPPPSEFEDGKDYDPVDTTTTNKTTTPLATMEDDLLYEEPVDLTDNTPSAPFEDVFSDTSYESYEEEDESSGLYINQDFHDDPNLVLPSNKKKKKKVDKGGTPAKCLVNVTFSGELYTKVTWSWSKRYCLVKDGKLMSFKSENATKAVLEVPLDGYDILYLEKEAKRNHVLRISRPGCETLFYSADTKEKVEQWQEVLRTASCGGSGGSVTTSGFSSAASSSPKIDKEGDTQLAVHADPGVRKSSSLTDLSMTSEGSSGDGTIGQPKTSDGDKKAPKTDRKGSKPIFDSLSTFFGTLSKKKGEKVQKAKLSDMEENLDPEANVCGYLSVFSEMMPSKKWNRRWCVVKQSILTIFKDIGEDAEFSLPLPGCEVVSACDPKRKMAMRIMEEGKEKIILDMPDTVAQGQWLNVLIRETGCAEGKGRFPANNGYGAGEEEDIYCDVDDDQDLLESWNLPKEWSLTSDSSAVSEATSRPSDKEADDNKKPPPLPSAPPPGVTLAKYLKKEQPKQNRASRRTSIKRPTEAPPSIPVVKRDDSDEKEVVKGHQGRTIEEDMDILATTKNPILSELRKKSRSGPVISKSPTPSSGTLSSPKTKSLTSATVDAMKHEKVDDSIEDTRRKLANIKKKRAEIRSRKLGCTDIEEKLRLDDKLRDLLRDQDNAEADLAKLTLKQAEIQAQERKARLEQESKARKDSLSRIERQGSFSRLEKKDSLSRFESGEWDLITRKTSAGSEDEGSRKSGTSTPRSNGSSPSTGRKANSLDRSSSPRTVTMNTKNGVGGPSGSRARNTRYTSDLTGRTTRTMAVSRTASMSSATRPDSPRGLRLTSRTEEEDRSPSPRGGRKQVQEKLKLWENISGSSNC